MKFIACCFLALSIFLSFPAAGLALGFRLPERSATGPSRSSDNGNDPLVDTRSHNAEEHVTLLPKPPKEEAGDKNSAMTKKGKNAGKKKAKKPAVKPVSEYKFEKIDHTPAYTFDRKTNPIIKEPKAKKKKPAAKKPAAKSAARSAAKAGTGSGDASDDGKLQFGGGN